MSVRRRIYNRVLVATLLAAGSLTLAGSALADYTGPDRVVSTWVWERLVCHYEAVYDPAGPGWWGCTLNLYEPPGGSCPSTGSVTGLFTPAACGWPQAFCQSPGCSVSLDASISGCTQGQPGCRSVEKQTSLPEATISGAIGCASPGSGGWCRAGGSLSLSASEPLSGESILIIEGTHNGAPFACPGSSCSLGLSEGSNDFSFWAHSSFGDTSRMGGASGKQDSQDPSISGNVSGTGGDNGWYISAVTISAGADDPAPGSGLSSFQVRVDGGGWASYSGPIGLGDGSHSVELRAVDGAGNSDTQNLSIDVDTGDPLVDLDATPSFCPGCGETADITVVVQDGISGVAAWTLKAGGVTVASGAGATSNTISWDGSGLGTGTYTLNLQGRDVAGNSAGSSFAVRLIAPTPVPPTKTSEPPPGSAARPVAPTATRRTPSATLDAETGPILPVPTRPSTSTPRTVPFGGPSSSLGAAPSSGGASAGSDPGLVSEPNTAAPALPPPALVGGAALALIAGASAYAAEQRRRRREEEARTREAMARANAAAEAREQVERARLAALYAAVAAAGSEVMRREAEEQRQLRMEELLAFEESLQPPEVSPPTEPEEPPPFDMAAWKRRDYAETAAWAEKQEVLRRAEAYRLWREQEARAGASSQPVLEPVPTFLSNPLGWVQATVINAGRQNETVRNALTATLAPAADSLRSIGETRGRVADAVVRGYQGFRTAVAASGALISYGFDAVRQGRWADARRAAEAWWRLPGATIDAITQTYDEQPLLAQVGVSMFPGGDLIDLAREGRRFVRGEDVDELVVGLSLVGLVMDLGVLDGLLPDPADAGNLAAGGIKAIIKAMPDGASRRLLEEMLANPAQWDELVETVNALISHQDELGALLRNDEALAAVFRGGPEAVELLLRHGDEGVALASRYGDLGVEMLGRHANDLTPSQINQLLRFMTSSEEVAPDVLRVFGESSVAIDEIPDLAGRRTIALGRLPDTTAAKEAGEQILEFENWTLEQNFLQLHEAIQNGDVVHLVSPVTAENLAHPHYGISVLARELDLLLQAGYRRVGEFLIPPP